MHNHKVLNDKPNETWINNCNCRNKDTCSLPKSWQTKCIVFQANTDCDIAEYKQKCCLGSCETTFKDCFWNHKKLFNHVKQVEHQKSHGRLSEYVVLIIQTVSAVFYV